MATDDVGGKEREGRHVYGPRPIGALLPAVTRPVFRRRAPGAAQLMADWAEIVGPALAAVTTPLRMGDGALTLACAGPVALELQHLAGPLMERINAHGGRVLVTRLRFVQDGAALARPPPPPRRPAPMPVDVPALPAGPLRDALAALGAEVGQARRADPA